MRVLVKGKAGRYLSLMSSFVENFGKLIEKEGAHVSSELASAILDSTVEWASLAERLVFELEKTGLIELDPKLGEDYQKACLEEPEKYRSMISEAE
jgi:hypothetical protein